MNSTQVPHTPSRNQPILYVIATVVVINLGLTIWNISDRSSSSHPAETDTPSLPPELDTPERTRLFAELQRRFNAGDVTALYELLGPVAQMQITMEDMQTEAIKLFEMFNSITDGAYSHFVFLGSQGSQSTFQLVYRVRFGSEQLREGLLLINIVTSGDGYEVVGFRLNST